MSFYKLQELENNLKLRNKLLKLGLGCPIVDPTGPKGDNEDKGSSPISTSESNYFSLLNDTDLKVVPGIYEITLSALVIDNDNNSDFNVYLQADSSSLKDLTYMLSANSAKQMQFSNHILFRFEKETVLQVITSILDNNVNILNVSLLMKK